MKFCRLYVATCCKFVFFTLHLVTASYSLGNADEVVLTESVDKLCNGIRDIKALNATEFIVVDMNGEPIKCSNIPEPKVSIVENYLKSFTKVQREYMSSTKDGYSSQNCRAAEIGQNHDSSIIFVRVEKSTLAKVESIASCLSVIKESLEKL